MQNEPKSQLPDSEPPNRSSGRAAFVFAALGLCLLLAALEFLRERASIILSCSLGASAVAFFVLALRSARSR